jgi:hypothetical protein
LAACHKLGQGDHVRSLHELIKSANVGEAKFEKKKKRKYMKRRRKKKIQGLG